MTIDPEQAKQELKAIKEERFIRESRKNMNLFCEMVMKDQRTGKPFVQAEMHKAMQDHVDWCLEEGFYAGIMSFWGCFPGDTLITMSNGSKKKIYEIKVGDYVLSTKIETLDFVSKIVTNTFNNGNKSIYRISTEENNIVYATWNHPFLVFDDLKWRKVYELKKGDLVALYKDEGILWNIIKKVEECSSEPTYNIEVEETHNYIANDFIVGNSGKTSQLVVPRALDFLGKNPNYRIKICCNIEQFAMQRVSAIRDYIENSEIYRKIYPNVYPEEKTKWGEQRINVKRTIYGASDFSLEAGGIFSSAISGRCDILIADDITDHKNSVLSPTLREKVIDSWNSNWKSRLEPEGFILYVGTPWHEKDCSYRQLDNKRFAFLIMEVAEDLSCLSVTKHYWTRTGEHEEEEIIDVEQQEAY
jgi:hypothetical protein